MTSPTNSKFTVGQLSPGIYRYSASVELDGKVEAVNGELTVQELQLESIELTARHQVLRNLSTNSGGEFFNLEDISSLSTHLANNQATGIIHTREEFKSLINQKWIFWLLVLLISTEWFVRKFSGSY